jgi:hypothetical protein
LMWTCDTLINVMHRLTDVSVEEIRTRNTAGSLRRLPGQLNRGQLHQRLVHARLQLLT